MLLVPDKPGLAGFHWIPVSTPALRENRCCWWLGHSSSVVLRMNDIESGIGTRISDGLWTGIPSQFVTKPTK